MFGGTFTDFVFGDPRQRVGNDGRGVGRRRRTFFDDETGRIECAENAFGAKVLPMSPV